MSNWWEGKIEKVDGLWKCGKCGRRYLKWREAKRCLELHEMLKTGEKGVTVWMIFDHHKKAVR